VGADRVSAHIGAGAGFVQVQVAGGAVDAHGGDAAGRAVHLEVQLGARFDAAQFVDVEAFDARLQRAGARMVLGLRRHRHGSGEQRECGNHCRGECLSGCCHDFLHEAFELSI
jgi:hypothetical protein